jgi:hypothetical protein
MTAKQLIEILQQFDPEIRVFVNGYEGGYSDATVSEIRDIALDVHTDWYYGTHEDAASELAKNKDRVIVKGIVL